MSAKVPPVKSQTESDRAAARGYWAETWVRFCRKKLSVAALLFVAGLGLVACLAPALAGTRPIVCKYKGGIYFPAMYYFNDRWENPIFFRDGFRQRFRKNLAEKDPESWAIWPLLFQDPFRRVSADEWDLHPGNPAGADADLGPTRNNLLGVDSKGIDVLARMIHGTRIALLVGFVSTGIAAVIGITIGATGGYFRGWIDLLLNGLTELVMCIPTLVLILALIAIIEKPTIWHTMVVLGATSWPGIARLTRGEFIRLSQLDYVTGARALGAGRFRIMFRHILPNALAPVLVPISFGIASAILVEAGLSFLGFGAPEPNPSWGILLNEARDNLSQWWLIVFPGTAIFLTVLAYNVIGEGLQEATDPRLREAGK